MLLLSTQLMCTNTEKKENIIMKKAFISICFITGILSTIGIFAFHYWLQYLHFVDTNDKLTFLFVKLEILFFGVLVLIGEIDIFLDILYFLSDRAKRSPCKTALNIICCTLSIGIIISAFDCYWQNSCRGIFLLFFLEIYALARCLYLVISITERHLS